ncbi:porin [Aliivibrio fischeri]|uniref:Porin n=1 Tax=Aliivibrio fischeri TaxID=668 RepID=A0A844NZT4_ALIFS|nr:porin [Aliivibrio fischeri]MUK29976.1 porin [Aliivibrio fischeri]MUK48517.1 porin [Aliivibrio fischeri]MUK61073.1 porin [Aliivibrio fischeri]MUK68557.1 porin [Aliivibrio fischeri]MUK73143.1 porin [Aliivibrio fischeri]
MKKTLLALAVPALLMAGSASAATVYTAEDGSTIDVYSRLGFNITDRAGMGEDGDAVGNFDARIGLGGSQVVNDKVSVIGWAEYSVGAAEQRGTDNSFTPRYVWAGIDASEAGKVTFGRVASGIIMLSDVGDVFAASDVLIGRQLELVDNSAAQTFRQDGTIQYQNSFGAFDMSVAYILGNSASDQDGSYNAVGRYTFDMGDAGQLIPIVAYQANSTGDNAVNPDADYTFWGAGLQYKLNALTLGAMYNQDEIEGVYSDKSTDKSYELTAVYNINDDWTARAGYRALENTGGDEAEYKDTTLELQYHLTARSSIYTSYVMRNGENGNALVPSNNVMSWNNAEEDYYHLGLRYEF